MIPAAITPEHIRLAVEKIKREGVDQNRRSVHYDLLIDGKPYPPKLVISLAALFAIGEEHSPSSFNAVEAKQYFVARGYLVNDRREHDPLFVAPEEDESAFPEGPGRYQLHRRAERDSALSRRVKRVRLQTTGTLECDVCGFDFSRRYGAIGRGFIEAHHLQPVHTLDGETKTRESDLSLVCSNCHRMLHHGDELLTLDQLREMIAAQAGT